MRLMLAQRRARVRSASERALDRPGARPSPGGADRRGCATSRRSTPRPWTAGRCGAGAETGQVRSARSSARAPPGAASTRRCCNRARRCASSPAQRSPAGADTVVIQEDARREGDRQVRLHRADRRSRGSRSGRAGGDFRAGDAVLLEAGTRLDAVAAGAAPPPRDGSGDLTVARRPRRRDPLHRRGDRAAPAEARHRSRSSNSGGPALSPV